MDLTLDQTGQIVDAALARAAELKLAPLAVAVLDSGGHLKAFARQDGAGIVRPQIAIGKAWGALGMGMELFQPGQRPIDRALGVDLRSSFDQPERPAPSQREQRKRFRLAVAS